MHGIAYIFTLKGCWTLEETPLSRVLSSVASPVAVTSKDVAESALMIIITNVKASRIVCGAARIITVYTSSPCLDRRRLASLSGTGVLETRQAEKSGKSVTFS
jgi:hypothetical protein